MLVRKKPLGYRLSIPKHLVGALKKKGKHDRISNIEIGDTM